jgi:hypothetical protein
MTHEEVVRLAAQARELSQNIQAVADSHAIELKKAQAAHKKITAEITEETAFDAAELTMAKAEILSYHLSVSGAHEPIPYVSFRGAGKLACIGVDMDALLEDCRKNPELTRFITLDETIVNSRLESMGMAHGLPESIIIDKAPETVVIAKK